jgi:hypothetical protein
MRGFLTACAALVLALPCRALPDDLTIRMFVHPAGERLHVLLRVPFKALNGVDFPSRGGNGELDLIRVDPMLPSVARWWIVENLAVYEGDIPLPKAQVVGTRVSLPSDDSFASYETARIHIVGAGPPASSPDDTQVFRDQAMLDVALEYPIHSDRSRFAIHSMLGLLGTHVLTDLRFLPPDGFSLGVARAFEYQGDPGLFALDPRWFGAVQRFLPFGFRHILKGTDYLLFLFCVALLLRKVAALVPFIGAFTIAYSTTLIASVYNLASDALWFPPLIETLIAAAILFLAFESIAGGNIVKRRRWIMAFGFGLVYGFGFSFALTPALQFAGSHILTAVLSFNLGIALGQILVLVLLLPVFNLLLRFQVNRRTETIVLAALAADTAWHWVTERADRLTQFSLQWPTLDAALLASGMLWLTIFLVLGGLACLVFAVLRHRTGTRERAPQTENPAAVADATLSGNERPGAL